MLLYSKRVSRRSGARPGAMTSGVHAEGGMATAPAPPAFAPAMGDAFEPEAPGAATEPLPATFHGADGVCWSEIAPEQPPAQRQARIARIFALGTMR